MNRPILLLALAALSLSTACYAPIPTDPTLPKLPHNLLEIDIEPPLDPEPVVSPIVPEPAFRPIPPVGLKPEDWSLIYKPLESPGTALGALNISKRGWNPKGRRKWKYILIHHSATEFGNAESFDKYHREGNGWINGLGYDFVIGNGKGAWDGQVEVGPRWVRQIDGAHAGNAEYNKRSIGICLVGDFEKTKPTRKQMRALVELIYFMQKKYNIPNSRIRLHKEVRQRGPTVCPGRNFDKKELFRLLKARANS